MIDKKGKLFGKVNIIDVVIVSAVIVLVAWFAWAKFGRDLRNEVAAREQPIEYTVVITGIRGTTADAVKTGDRMFEFKTGALIGTVKSVSTEPQELVILGGGVAVRMDDPKRVDAFVTLQGTARVSEDVVTVNGVEIRVGASVGLKSKYVQAQGNVMSMELPEDEPR